MTKEEKEKLYEPQEWALYINGQFHTTYPSHVAASVVTAKVELTNTPLLKGI